MKKSILLIFALMLTGTMAMAQNDDNQNSNNNMQNRKAPDATEMATRQTERMVKELSLNDTQKAALLQLNKQYAGKMGGMMGRHGGQRQMKSNSSSSTDGTTGTTMQNKRQRPSDSDMQKMGTNNNSQMTEYNTQLKKILTTEQYNTYTQKMQNRGQGGQRGQKGQKRQKGQDNGQESQGQPDEQNNNE